MTPRVDIPVNTSQAPLQKVPGHTVGFAVMTLIILFITFWMNRQSSLLQLSVSNELPDVIPALDGFLSNAWFLPDDEMLGFVEIPAGSFIMGSNPVIDRLAYENERWSDLSRQGSVDLPAFYISRFETTVAQFFAFADDTELSVDSIGTPVLGNYPVTGITWPEALAYGRWLERRLRESPVTPQAIRQLLNNGGRVTLPSEAEWEKAARGTDGRVFTWGSQPQAGFSNFNADAISPVGSFSCPGCAHGLSDMAGNVWELTRSPLQDYPYDLTDDAADLAEDALYVMRGGSYDDAINNVRTAVRGAADPGVRTSTIGFRVVISEL
ncbi:MAG: formylglycine-generating enzyme family protein [Pseudomonadales bacterium]|nr:formylglycine-generating enzyme family protein [Pseudomonadales bacterium]